MSATQVALLGAIAGFTIFLGLPIGRLRRRAPRLKAALNGTAIGILIFLVWDILTHAWEPIDSGLAHHSFGGAALNSVILAAGLALGMGGLVAYDQSVARRRSTASSTIAAQTGPSDHRNGATGGTALKTHTDALVRTAPRSNAVELSLMIAIGIGLHNFAEGLAIGSSAAAGDLSLAVLLVIGFALHNATEGFGIVAPLAGEAQRPSWARLGALGLIGGSPTLIGTLIGQTTTNEALGVAFLGLAAGSLLYVVIELLAVARRANLKTLTTWYILLGLGLGFLTDGVLVAAGA